MSEPTPVGKTKTQGWEIGVQRTFPVSTVELWDMLTTQPGLGYWLGTGITANFKKGDTFQTTEGTRGEIRSHTHGSLIRMRWQPAWSDHESTLQIRVTPMKTGARLAIHHELLESGEERAEMHRHWLGVVEQFRALIG